MGTTLGWVLSSLSLNGVMAVQRTRLSVDHLNDVMFIVGPRLAHSMAIINRMYEQWLSMSKNVEWICMHLL